MSVAPADVAALARFMRDELAAGAWSAIVAPPRSVVVQEAPFAAFGAMSALSRRHGLYVAKVAGYVAPPPDQPRRGVDGRVIVMCTLTGRVLATLDGAVATQAKCAAATCMATDVAACDEAKVLAVVGAGALARAQVAGVLACRPVRELRVCARTRAGAQAFCDELAGWVPAHVRLSIEATAAAAVAQADIVCTATPSIEPLIDGDWLKPGVHVNCMGAHTPLSRELSHDTLRASQLLVEDVDTAVREAGEVHRDALPLAQLHRANAAVLKAARTVFSSTGHAVLDLLTAAHLIRREDGAAHPAA